MPLADAEKRKETQTAANKAKSNPLNQKQTQTKHFKKQAGRPEKTRGHKETHDRTQKPSCHCALKKKGN
jgi:hypothetical protein